MTNQADLIAEDIDSYLAQHEQKELVRFLTCGSVDDGKSTLIGRLFYDAKLIYEDQLATLEKDSATHGTTGGGFDPALFTDGLKAEREQGITIEVAYRYFSTARRKFIIADTPGHIQYTRNMATGASTADLAIVLIDARKGVVEQTKRHTFIASLLGIRHVLVAVNKMDLVDFRQEVFEEIREDFEAFSTRLDLPDLKYIPISALHGDNLVDHSDRMPWYEGSTLMHFLDTVHISSDRNYEDFRFPVQYVNRPNLDFRGFAGTIASGVIHKGDEIVILPSRITSTVKSIVTYDGELDEAVTPQSVTLTLADEVDVSRGDMIVRPEDLPHHGRNLEATLVWMDEEPLVPGKQYQFKQTTKAVTGSISTLRYRIDVNSLERRDAPTLALNEIGRCVLALNQPLNYDGYRRNRATGSFIVVDRLTNGTVAAGMIIDRSDDPRPDHWDDETQHPTRTLEHGNVSADERIARFGQQPVTILMTGLSRSGKTATAYALERRLFEAGGAVTVLDGLNMRLGIGRDLGFTAAERSENLRRSSEVAKLMNDSGMICIAAFVSPHADIRQRARELVGPERFLTVYFNTPIEVCRQRDEDDVYEKADSGEIPDFPGVSAEYEVPLDADLTLPADKLSVDECVDRLMELLRDRDFIA